MLRNLFFLRLLVLFLSALSGFAMPPRDAGPEPDHPAGVNQPSPARLHRDHPDLEGEWQCLVLLVDFPDYPWDNQEDTLFDNEGLPYPQQHFQEMLFSEGEFAHPGAQSEYTGSMRDYFNEVSAGDYTVTGVVSSWYRAPQPYRFYCNADGEFGTGDDYGYSGIQSLVSGVVRSADRDFDFSRFDNDADRQVDALFIVHAGPEAEEFGRNEIGANYFWSHKWSIPELRCDGVSISEYTTEPQTGAIGVFCHEFGHALGLPDLYDTDLSSEGVGEWCLMGSGGWGFRSGDLRGTCPVHLCGWAKMELGWVRTTDVEDSLENALIGPVETSQVVVRLWVRQGASPEFFLLENRRRIGFDSGLTRRQMEYDLPAPGGLLITHIDQALRERRHGANDEDDHRLVDVEEASPVFINGEPFEHLDGPRVRPEDRLLVNPNRGDNGDLWPGWSNIAEDFNDYIGARDRTRFGINTIPSSAGYNRRPSLAQVYNIRLEGDNVVASFSVDTPNEPLIFVDSLSINDNNGGNGDGMIQPGETIALAVRLGNLGALRAAEVQASLNYEGDRAEIIRAETAYPDIQPDQSVPPESPFIITVSPQALPGSLLEFTMFVTTNDTFQFELPIYLDLVSFENFYKFPNNPVLAGIEGAWNARMWSPAVIVEDSLVKCWFIGVNESGGRDQAGDVGYAVSRDGGITWEVYPDKIINSELIPWSDWGFKGLDVFSLAGGGYIMMFTAEDAADSLYKVGQAGSPDGFNWQVIEHPVIAPEGRLVSAILPTQVAVGVWNDSLYACMFSARTTQSIWALTTALSSDFNSWSIHPELTVPPSGQPERFDSLAAMAPAAIRDRNGQTVIILYTGLKRDFIGRLGIVSYCNGHLTYYQGSEEGGAMLVRDEREGPRLLDLFGGRLFWWRDELRMLYCAYNAEGPTAIYLASTWRFNRTSPDKPTPEVHLPQNLTLERLFPNPFNRDLSLIYRLNAPALVKVEVIDLNGRQINLLTEAWREAGSYKIIWDGADRQGKPAAGGIYIIRISAGGEDIRTKVVMIK